MTIFNYLQLQPIDPQDDGSVSQLDDYAQDDTIDLSQEADGEQLVEEWDEIEADLQAANMPSTTEVPPVSTTHPKTL